MATTQVIPSIRSRSLPRIGDRLIALAVGICTVVLLVLTAPHIGLTWDEPVYTVAQESYTGWLQQLREAPAFALSRQGIDTWWNVNHEHPPLDKLYSGLIYGVAQGFFDDLTAYRLGNMLLVGLLVGMIYLMAAESYGRWAGLFAVAALLSMPRFFFHAHLAALDVPGAVAFFAVISVAWHTRHAKGFWPSVAVGLLLGLVWGIGLATKINAAFALPVLGLWMLLFARRWGIFLRLTLMVATGPGVFLLLWPWLYFDTWKRLEAYIKFITVDHWEIDQWYFGVSHMPTTLLILAIVGLVRGWRDRRESWPVGLWSLGALVPLLALTTGQSMVYDNERLFMPAFPFLALLAGLGLDWLLVGIPRFLAQRGRIASIAAISIVLSAFAPQTIQSALLYPHLLSYYSETVGGLPGATSRGMETSYWCETYATTIDYINTNARQGAIVWVEDWSHDVLLTYQQVGRLRTDLKIARVSGAGSPMPGGMSRTIEAGIWEADYAIVAVRESGLTNEVNRFRNENTPVFIIERQGVVLTELYERK
jgi:4-amino-4-deoxy-L-arabinose transferase-like glycosyltransferase